MRARAALGACVAAGILGCGAPATTPTGTALAYFATLGRDPIRSADLVTDGFQERHGLRVVTRAQLEGWQRRVGAGDASSSSGAGTDAARSLHHDQIAWLGVQMKPDFPARAAALSVTPLEERVDGDRASVSMRVTPPEAPPFVQRFELVRDGARAPWRIDAIAQEGVDERNLAAAFVAAPSEALRRRLAASLGVPAD